MATVLEEPGKLARRHSAAWANLSLLAIPLAVLAIMGYRRRWVSDDAFISLRVVGNLLEGNGPVFNIAERVEVYTHPLWLALMALWGAPGWSLEVGAAGLGLAFSLAGLGAGMAACVGLLQTTAPTGAADRSSDQALALPLGALVFVALPVVWDFATSGLETGLIFFWLGACFWLLARVCRRLRPAGSLHLVAVLLGLGPLVRPDLAIHSCGLLIALLVAAGEQRRVRSPLRGAGLLAAAVALPALYQLFRMGYFAAWVPNTALAKEAGLANWLQGWRYLQDFVSPYWLWLPVVLLAVYWLAARADGGRHGRRAVSVLLTAPVASALVHTLYIVRLGGDFMHGRMLLPPLFAILLPSMVVRLPRPGRLPLGRAVTGAAALGIALWVLACGLWLRWPHGAEVGPRGIADERAVYVRLTGNANPVRIADFRRMRLRWAKQGEGLRRLAASYPRTLRRRGRTLGPLDPKLDSRVGLVDLAPNIGIRGFAAGSSVHLVDSLGLADPIASRMRIRKRGRPGHEKRIPLPWVQARFTDPSELAGADPSVAAAAEALACGELAELLEAVGEDLTLKRFVANLAGSLRLTRLRIDPDPSAAREEFCAASG